MLFANNQPDADELKGWHNPYMCDRLLELSFIDGYVIETLDKTDEARKHQLYEAELMSKLEEVAKKKKCWRGRETKYYKEFAALEKQMRKEMPYLGEENWWDDVFATIW